MSTQPSERVKATWSISLDVWCPKCDELFDIIEQDSGEFWHSAIEPIEHGTDATKGYETVCPKCKHEFVCDFVY